MSFSAGFVLQCNVVLAAGRTLIWRQNDCSLCALIVWSYCVRVHVCVCLCLFPFLSLCLSTPNPSAFSLCVLYRVCLVTHK